MIPKLCEAQPLRESFFSYYQGKKSSIQFIILGKGSKIILKLMLMHWDSFQELKYVCYLLRWTANIQL